MQTLNTDPVATCLNRLIAMDKIIGSNHYSGQVRKAATELLAPKINRITQLARQISTAAITGIAARSGNVVAAVGMKVATTGFGML
jgi:translation elongation factor EF-G